MSSEEAPNSIATATLGDQDPGLGADDVRAEDPIGRRVGQELHEPVGQSDRPRATVRHERELAGLVGDAGLLELLLGLADRGHLRCRVDHARDDVVVDVRLLADQLLGDAGALLLGLVRQHRPDDHVADRPDARDAGAEVAVGLDPASIVQPHAHLLQAQPFRVGLPSDRDQDGVALDRLRRTALGRLDGHLDRLARAVDAGDLGAELERHALLLQDLLEFLRHLAVHARRDAVQELDHGDLRPEPPPHGAHLEADIPGTDDQQVLGHPLQIQRTGRGDDAVLVDADPR